MLVEWLVQEKWLRYLQIIPKEVEEEDDQKTDGENLYKQILVGTKLKTGKRGK